MKIAIVAQPIDELSPESRSSIGILTWNTARLLSKQHDVTICAPAYSGSGTELTVDGVKLRYVSMRTDNYLMRASNRLGIGDLFGSFYSALYASSYIVRVGLLLRKANVDVVQLINFSQFAPVVKRLCPRAKVVLEMHCEWLTQIDPVTVSKRLRSVDLVTGCSKYICRLIQDAFPAMQSACAPVYNGLDYDKVLRRSESSVAETTPLRVYFVGRVSPEKGVHDVIQAIGCLVDAGLDVRLILVGPRETLPRSYIVDASSDPLVKSLSKFYDGTTATNYQDHLDLLVETHGLVGAVHFVGELEREQVYREYAKADILVNASYSESFGMGVIEAMAAGVPVVVTPVGGMSELVESGRTGLLAKVGDSEDLASKIRLLSEDGALAEALRTEALGEAKKYSWQARSDRLSELYAAILD